MSAGEIVVLVVVCVAFVAAVVGIIIGKIRHKGGCCDCGCGKGSACANGCAHCASVPADKQKPHQQN